MAVVANAVKDLVAVVRDISSTGEVAISTAVKCKVRLEHDGDAGDGKFWDTNAGGAWSAVGSVTTWPAATSDAQGTAIYQLPAAASSGHEGGSIHFVFTDDAATPASETVVSGDREHPIVDSYSVWDEIDTDHVVASSFGEWLGVTLPALLSNISSVGAAVNVPPASYVLTTGTQSSGTIASVAELDGTRHEHTDNAGAMDLYYESQIGSGTPTSVTVTGYLTGNNDDLEVYAWDWVASVWTQIGEMAGKSGAKNDVNIYSLYTTHVGTGSNVGKVRIRFTDGAFTLTSATLRIDQIYVSFATGAGSYEGGAIWIDTSLSNTNVVVGVDGTSTNPVSTIAAALSLSALTNINKFAVAPGSSITLAASLDGFEMHGDNWVLALGGQSLSDTHIRGATVSGICTGTSPPRFTQCSLQAAATVPPCEMDFCSWGDTLTCGSAGDYYFNDCVSRIAGAGAPTLDLGAGVGATNVSIRRYSGGLTVSNVESGDVMSFGGSDTGTLTLGGADGTVDARGTGKPVVDNRTGTPTLTTTGYVNTNIAGLNDLSQSDIISDATPFPGANIDATISSISGLTGPIAITVEVRDGSSAAVPFTLLGIYNEANDSPIGRVTTDANGDVAFNMATGNYNIRPFALNYSFTTPQAFTVSVDATVEVTATAVSVAAPVAANGCTVFGYLFAGSAAHEGVVVEMYEAVDVPQKAGSVIMTSLIKRDTTDSAGLFEVEMAQSTDIVVVIRESGIKFRISLGDTDTHDVSDEIA